jgi:hypothetical protein
VFGWTETVVAPVLMRPRLDANIYNTNNRKSAWVEHDLRAIWQYDRRATPMAGQAALPLQPWPLNTTKERNQWINTSYRPLQFLLSHFASSHS